MSTKLPAQIRPPVGQGTESGPDPGLAQWWRRLLAFVIDCLILTIATGALWGRLIASFANRLDNAHSTVGNVLSQTVGPYLIVLVFTICLAVTYYWLLTWRWGTTIGKRSLRTWVVAASDRSKVSLGASFARAVVFVVGGEVIPLFFGIDNLWLGWDPRRQALHDKAARTLVVTTPPAAPASPVTASSGPRAGER